jgi:hypothetical protein
MEIVVLFQPFLKGGGDASVFRLHSLITEMLSKAYLPDK